MSSWISHLYVSWVQVFWINLILSQSCQGTCQPLAGHHLAKHGPCCRRASFPHPISIRTIFPLGLSPKGSQGFRKLKWERVPSTASSFYPATENRHNKGSSTLPYSSLAKCTYIIEVDKRKYVQLQRKQIILKCNYELY